MKKDITLEKFTEKVEAKLLAKKNAPLIKVFKFTMEYLQDNPTGMGIVVKEYVAEHMYPHRHKIKSFEFEYGIDELTMSPVLFLRMKLVDEITSGFPTTFKY